MRSELGKLPLDAVLSEREALNLNIVASIKPAADAWGLEVLRYEIKDIIPPKSIVQVSAGVRAATARAWAPRAGLQNCCGGRAGTG